MKNILVAEDATRIASFIIKGLVSNGYTATHVADGAAVIPKLMSENFDLLILDIGLPNRDGLSILEELRGTGNEIPVIILTARDSVETTVASFHGGADDFMAKPFSFQELLARIERRIQTEPVSKKSEANKSSITIGDVKLDLLNRVVVVKSGTHELTQREFVMLEFFMRNAGQVISREQLLNRVWRLDHDPGSNIVDVYIRYLRQKLGPEVIQTVRGLGYTFQA